MAKHYARDEVYYVVSSKEYHEVELEDHSHEAKVGHFAPALSLVLTKVYHTAAYVPREEEIISLSIRYRNGVKTGEVPQISVRVTHPKHLLKHKVTKHLLKA